jgi:CRISPR system Cascade subunit CasB
MIRNEAGAVAWWRAITPNPPHHDGDRGARAGLRRCATVAEAMTEPATLVLFRRCGAEDPRDLVAVALAAAVLAHVREDRAEMTVARLVGPESPDRPETALLKPLRFRRLLEAATADDCLIAFRRLVAIADGRLSVGDLARGLFDWTNPHRAEAAKRRWIFAYWNANPAGKAEETAA